MHRKAGRSAQDSVAFRVADDACDIARVKGFDVFLLVVGKSGGCLLATILIEAEAGGELSKIVADGSFCASD
jgi:hypothetical protein